MEIVPYLSAVILIATIATIVLALLSYVAFKLRDRRRPGKKAQNPVFFRCFELDDPEPGADGEGGGR